MPEVTLRVFDPNITQNSPAGSCVLKMLQAASQRFKLELFTSLSDLKPGSTITIHRMPVPMRPIFVQSIFFTLLAIVCSFLTRKPVKGITISTQGGFPFCDISYAHCCHRLFLTRYRNQISGGFFRRTARLVNHYWSASMERIAFTRATTIVVPSKGLANELVSAYGLQLASKLQIVANPVDCLRFAPPETNCQRDEFTFAFCALGNFEWKGLSLMLEALAHVGGRLKVIGGTGRELAQFKQKARSLGVAERVSFLGLQDDIRPHLWSSDVFALPSVYETFPLVCLQAAAAGLPLIATNLYGLEELLKPDVSGWRVDRNVGSIQSAMQAALRNPDASAAMGRHAKHLASQYDTSKFQHRWLALLAPDYKYSGV